MIDPANYLSINKDTWNKKTQIHFDSEFYSVASFIKGESSLKEIELAMLGDLNGKKVLHLQCHFGQDSISLARMGAEVTAIDLSDVAIEKAKLLAKQTNAEVEFICCNIYDLPKHCSSQFDVVFTSYGVIGWLPDLSKWANIVSHFLKKDGQFVFVEFHPVVWMFDNDFNEVAYRYFKTDAIIENEKGTYADKEADIEQTTITWNHGLGEVVNHLINSGLKINAINEFDYSPYNCFNHTKEVEPGKFIIQHFDNKIPMVYSIAATKI